MKRILPITATAFLFVLFMCYALAPDPFESKTLDPSIAMEHIEVLSSPQMDGRQTGTYGNEHAMDYVKKELSAMGFSITEMPFNAQVPFFDAESIFSFDNEQGQKVSFTAFEDYKFTSWGPGGSLEYQGDLIFADDNAYNLPNELLKDKVVVTESSPFIGDSLVTLMDAGVKGILYYPNLFSGVENADEFVKMQTLSMGIKPGNTIGLGFLSRDLFAQLKTAARANAFTVDKKVPAGTIYGIIKNATISEKMEFKTVETQNFYVSIEGKNKDSKMVIVADIDHVGRLNETQYFPGAVQNASSVSMLIELARSFKESGVKPDQTLIFMVLNASESDHQGVQSMLKQTGMNADHIQVLAIDQVGSDASEGFVMTSSGESSKILVSKMTAIAEDQSIPVAFNRSVFGKNVQYRQHNIPTITISGGVINAHQMTDTAASISDTQLNDAFQLSQAYIASEVYGMNPWQLFNLKEWGWIVGIFIYLFILYVLEQFKAHYLWVNKLYYSSVVMILKKLGTVLTLVSILILLVFITKLPRDMNIAIIAGEMDTNFSAYLTFKHALDFIRMVFVTGIQEWDFIVRALIKSLILYGFAIGFGLFMGVFKGLYDAYSEKNDSEWRSFMSLTILSVPDIIWILLANFIIVKLSQWMPLPALRQWFFPILTLSIMPIVAVSRVTFVAFEKEKTKPYYLALKSRGLSKWRIFSRHLIHPAFESALASMLGLTSVLISNMIIVEYLFDYKGLANFVLIADKTKDQVTFISLIAAISLLYVLSSAIIRTLIGWMRKGGANHD